MNVSVPLRGNGRETAVGRNTTTATTMFPSPCGVMVVKHLKILRRLENANRVSVPLRGNGRETGFVRTRVKQIL